MIQIFYFLQYYVMYNPTVTGGFIIGMSVVGIFMTVVFLLNIIAIGGIKLRKYFTDTKFRFKLTKSKMAKHK